MSKLADAQSSAEEAPRGIAKAALAEILQPLCDSLESGIMLIGSDSRITTCNLAMAMMFGQTPEALVGLAKADFDALALGLMNEPPKPLCDKGLFPIGSAVRCEEFEVSRPARTVARWVARKVQCPHYAIVAVATDITADVDINSAYEKMALTDRLTGIANRRGIEREISQELLRLRRFQTPLSFALFDIDHFKVINDSHGHGTGDEVLRLVAKAISSSVRDTDRVARWGGDEFLVVLPETSYTGALLCAEKIRAKVETVSLRVGFSVTISGGVYQPCHGESISDLMTRTDARLYEAKNTGRNRIC
ncbi:MAG TPA: sensor domain-containing diguanylate cyclase [Polyangia bacterium]